MNYKHLTIEERSCIRKYYVEGLSYLKITKLTGKSPNTKNKKRSFFHGFLLVNLLHFNFVVIRYFRINFFLCFHWFYLVHFYILLKIMNQFQNIVFKALCHMQTFNIFLMLIYSCIFWAYLNLSLLMFMFTLHFGYI